VVTHEVEKQRTETGFVQLFSYHSVSWTKSTASAAMRKNDKAFGFNGEGDFTFEIKIFNRELKN
jgi:hypothetical protein